MKFVAGDFVQKNPATWIPYEFDSWGRGIGIGHVIERIDDLFVDVRWPGGICYEDDVQLLPAVTPSKDVG